MAIADYDTLRAAIQTWAARSDSKFSAQIPVFVALAEERLYNGGGAGPEDPLYTEPLRSSMMDASITVSVVDGVGAMPPLNIEARKIYPTGQTTGISYLPPERFEYEANNISGTTPIYYTVEVDNTLSILPAISTTIDVDYWTRFDPITDINKTGPLLTAHGLLYLEAALFEAFAFLQEENLAMGHLAKARSLIAGANRATSRFPGKLQARPRFAIP